MQRGNGARVKICCHREGEIRGREAGTACPLLVFGSVEAAVSSLPVCLWGWGGGILRSEGARIVAGGGRASARGEVNAYMSSCFVVTALRAAGIAATSSTPRWTVGYSTPVRTIWRCRNVRHCSISPQPAGLNVDSRGWSKARRASDTPGKSPPARALRSGGSPTETRLSPPCLQGPSPVHSR